MIRFPDRKSAPKGGEYGACDAVRGGAYNALSSNPITDHEPHPHPAAPQAVAKDFSHFQEVFQSGPHFHPEKIQTSASPSPSSSSSGGEVFDDLHDLPKRFWQTPSLLIGEREMDAINVSGQHGELGSGAAC